MLFLPEEMPECPVHPDVHPFGHFDKKFFLLLVSSCRKYRKTAPLSQIFSTLPRPIAPVKGAAPQMPNNINTIHMKKTYLSPSIEYHAIEVEHNFAGSLDLVRSTPTWDWDEEDVE